MFSILRCGKINKSVELSDAEAMQMPNLLVSLTPVLTAELQEFYEVELDMREHFIELDMSKNVTELSGIILENISLLGAFSLPEEFWNAMLDRAQKIYSQLLACSYIHLSWEDEDILCLTMVELARRSDAEDEDGRMWDYLSLQLGWFPGCKVSRQNMDNRLRDILKHSIQRHNRYFAEDGQRYYTTLQLHALSPVWSVEHLLNILYSFYAKSLEYQYTPKDSSIPIFVRNIVQRWNKQQIVDTTDARLRSDSLASGFRTLFQHRPHFMAAICDMLLGKLDTMLTGNFSLLSQENRWDRILLDWYNKRTDSEKRDMVTRRKNRSWNKVITRKEHICLEYFLDDEELCLRLPKLRLPEIEISKPPILELYQGSKMIYSRFLSVFGDLCYTTREITLCLTGQGTSMNPNLPFDVSVRLCCGEEVVYQSGGDLMRDYLVFDCSGEEIKVLPPGLGRVYLLTNSRAEVELPKEEDINMFSSFGKLYSLSAEIARQALINGQPVLPETRARSCLCVSFTKAPETMEVLSGDRKLQVFGAPPEARIISTKEGAERRYVVLRNNIRSQLYSYGHDNSGSSFLVPLPKMPNYPHTFQIFDIETEKLVFALEYIVLNKIAYTFDQSFYLNRNCSGLASIRAGGNARTIVFNLEPRQKQVSFSLWSTYIAVVPVPRLEISINGENALTMQRSWIWHEELRQGTFVSIHCPVGVTAELVLGTQKVPAVKRGKLFELGNFLNAQGQVKEASLSLGVIVREEGKPPQDILLADVLFHADLIACPIHVEGRRIDWNPEDCFRGASEAEFFVLLENDQSEEPWRFRAGLRPDILERKFPCRDGYYGFQILLREKKGIFVKAEDRLLWEGQLKIGEPERNRWRGKELHLTMAHYRTEKGHSQTVPIQNNGAIIVHPEYVGLSAPENQDDVPLLPEYRGHLCWETWDGRRYYFTDNRDNQSYQWVNPLRFWLDSETDRLYIQTADETALLFSLKRPL